MDFIFIKHSSQGRLTATNRTVGKLFFTEKHRHLPIASVNDPFRLLFPFIYLDASGLHHNTCLHGCYALKIISEGQKFLQSDDYNQPF